MIKIGGYHEYDAFKIENELHLYILDNGEIHDYLNANKEPPWFRHIHIKTNIFTQTLAISFKSATIDDINTVITLRNLDANIYSLPTYLTEANGEVCFYGKTYKVSRLEMMMRFNK